MNEWIKVRTGKRWFAGNRQTLSRCRSVEMGWEVWLWLWEGTEHRNKTTRGTRELRVCVCWCVVRAPSYHFLCAWSSLFLSLSFLLSSFPSFPLSFVSFILHFRPPSRSSSHSHIILHSFFGPGLFTYISESTGCLLTLSSPSHPNCSLFSSCLVSFPPLHSHQGA